MSLKHPLHHGIELTLNFVGYQAAVAAGLDLYEWEFGNKYDVRVAGYTFKERVVAQYMISNMISAHISDAQADEIERASRRRSK